MMVLIDSSVWIEFFRRKGNEACKEKVGLLLEEADAAYSCPILLELMAGAKPHEIEEINRALSLSKRYSFAPDFWMRAAEAERGLRQSGFSVNRADVLIAVVAHEHRLPILSRDRDFATIRAKSNLSFDLAFA